MIRIKRVYEPAAPGDGLRILVERLWPRGLKKTDAKIDDWIKEVAPSTELRKWFSHDPVKWPEFLLRYRAELDQRPETWEPLLAIAKKRDVTLLFSSHDAEHNNVVALSAYLQKRLKPAKKS